MFLKLEVSLLKCDRYMGEKCQDHTYTIWEAEKRLAQFHL
jgi:hypothetical protein